MEKVNRREFLNRSVAVGVVSSFAISAKGSAGMSGVAGPKRPAKDDISLAQWALVSEIREGKWKNSDFPKIAREDFDINGVEFVSTLFELPTYSYLKRLRQNAEKYKVTMILIMVDDEGETCDPSRGTRIQTAINHRKWVDIAKYLGCHSIRTNCRGPKNAPKDQALEWAADCYNRLLEYAAPAGIGILIENHGGLSNDPEWMISLFKKVDNPYFGSYPDWRGPGREFDNYAYLKKMLPYAGGMSYRNQPTEKQTARLIKLCQDSGYRGWYGIESGGREQIKQGKKLLEKYLFGKR
ncbi:MAG: sugar phosphate isomerase/epimerase family protein [Planctomycetota bacterium]|jgi:hydroxypyruvate isomerase